jgi:hypothetical protein
MNIHIIQSPWDDQTIHYLTKAYLYTTSVVKFSCNRPVRARKFYEDETAWNIEYQGYFTDIIKRGGNILIAVPADDHTQYLGYILYENVAGNLVLHFASVKPEFQHMGIFKALLFRAGFTLKTPIPVSKYYPIMKQYRDKLYKPILDRRYFPKESQ